MDIKEKMLYKPRNHPGLLNGPRDVCLYDTNYTRNYKPLPYQREDFFSARDYANSIKSNLKKGHINFGTSEFDFCRYVETKGIVGEPPPNQNYFEPSREIKKRIPNFPKNYDCIKFPVPNYRILNNQVDLQSVKRETEKLPYEVKDEMFKKVNWTSTSRKAMAEAGIPIPQKHVPNTAYENNSYTLQRRPYWPAANTIHDQPYLWDRLQERAHNHRFKNWWDKNECKNYEPSTKLTRIPRWQAEYAGAVGDCTEYPVDPNVRKQIECLAKYDQFSQPFKRFSPGYAAHPVREAHEYPKPKNLPEFPLESSYQANFLPDCQGISSTTKRIKQASKDLADYKTVASDMVRMNKVYEKLFPTKYEDVIIPPSKLAELQKIKKELHEPEHENIFRSPTWKPEKVD